MPWQRLNDPGYVGIHQRLKRGENGDITTMTCRHCGGQASDWAYDHEDPEEKKDERGTYSINLSHYFPLCRSCHFRFDRKEHCPNGHEFTEANSYWYREHRLCRKCRTEYMREWRRRSVT